MTKITNRTLTAIILFIAVLAAMSSCSVREYRDVIAQGREKPNSDIDKMTILEEWVSQYGLFSKIILVNSSEEQTAAATKENKEDEWKLILVNASNPLPEGYKPELLPLDNGLEFDKRAIDKLNAMLDAAKAQGLSPVVCSAYRDIEKQELLYISQVKKQQRKGLSQVEAKIKAATVVAFPGTSEHQLGLAVDIVSSAYMLLEEEQENTNELKWLVEHCHEYGFILRYPKGKEEITGIIYEPWHFRYVGEAAAGEIMGKGICLEEYIGSVTSVKN